MVCGMSICRSTASLCPVSFRREPWERTWTSLAIVSRVTEFVGRLRHRWPVKGCFAQATTLFAFELIG